MAKQIQGQVKGLKLNQFKKNFDTMAADEEPKEEASEEKEEAEKEEEKPEEESSEN